MPSIAEIIGIVFGALPDAVMFPSMAIIVVVLFWRTVREIFSPHYRELARRERTAEVLSKFHALRAQQIEAGMDTSDVDELLSQGWASIRRDPAEGQELSRKLKAALSSAYAYEDAVPPLWMRVFASICGATIATAPMALNALQRLSEAHQAVPDVGAPVVALPLVGVWLLGIYLSTISRLPHLLLYALLSAAVPALAAQLAGMAAASLSY